MEATNHSGIEDQLGYRFLDKDLLAEALRHSSYVNEISDSGMRDNERLEFLGDAVLNLIVGHVLMERYPDLKEGDLSRMRASLVNEAQLAKMARDLGLGTYILLGKGEIQTNGQEKSSILADTFEALMAAVYLDGGFDAAATLIETNVDPVIVHLDTTASNLDYKSQLQEYVQVKQREMPTYSILRAEGPDHDKTFWVSLRVSDVETEGVGKNKKTAEQDAARQALEILQTVK
jgi:ribonuclease-3